MKLLEVIPIARGISAETLTYFTASEVAIGSIVKVPLRKKTIPAIVLSLQEVSEAKSSIKDLAYSVRKIKEIKSFDLILPKFMEASKEIADYLAASTGSVMNSIIPKNILLNADKLKIEIKAGAANSRPHEKFVLQADDEERYANYRSFIREEFAKGFSVFFCLPTIQDIKKTFEVLSKGIEQYAFILHSGMPKKEVLKNWMKVLSEAHPV